MADGEHVVPASARIPLEGLTVAQLLDAAERHGVAIHLGRHRSIHLSDLDVINGGSQ